MNWVKEMWIIGFALFSMFFGAGNVIFPPYIGYNSGSQWQLSFVCYYMADIGLGLVAIWAMLKCGSDIDGITRRIGAAPAKLLSLVIMLCIGPLIAIPRTAATTYELSILPLTNGVNPQIFSVIFFSLVLMLCIKESSVLDIVGKFLTPVLFISLIAIGIKSFVTPLGEIVTMSKTNQVISEGIMAGYQTMDVLASLLFGVIILKTLEEKGYTDMVSRNKIIGGAGIITGIGLFLVYGGLAHLGATTSTIFPPEISRVNLVTESVTMLFGNFGIMLLCVMVALACLTTAIGLTSSAGAYISKITNEKISYKAVVIAISVFSAIISTMGVDAIVDYAALILTIVYAPAVTLIILTVYGKHIKNDNIFKGGALAAFIVSILALALKHGIGSFEFINMFPLSNIDLGWIVPAIVGCILGSFIKPPVEEEIE